jgi:proton glutamate symport protein
MATEGGEATRVGKGMGLGTKILIGMGVGAAIGGVLGPRASVLQPVGDGFIRLLILAAVPLVVFNLLAGLTALTDLRTLGRLAGKTVGFYFATTAFAVGLGILAMMVWRPGVGMTLAGQGPTDLGGAPSVAEILLDLIPMNLFAAFAEGNVTQLVVVAVLLGVATIFLPPDPRDRLRDLFADVALLFRKLVDLILIVAPYGIGALMAVTVGVYGAELFGPMAIFIVGVTTAHAVVFGVYMVLLRFFTDWRPWAFLKASGPIWATTASTTSSLASLSVSLDMAERMGFQRSLFAFTLPLGAQINKDGTSVFLGAVTVFTAQAAGITLTGPEIATVALMGFLLSLGSGGIPGGGFVVGLILVESLGLPLELAAVVGGIYRLVDMGATTLNVMGDMVATAMVARSERRNHPRGASGTSEA